MLIKQGSINKEAFLGAVGSALGRVAMAPFSLAGKAVGGAVGFGAKGLLKGGWGGLKFAVKNPTAAVTLGGVGYGMKDTAAKGLSQISEAAATPYRYF